MHTLRFLKLYTFSLGGSVFSLRAAALWLTAVLMLPLVVIASYLLSGGASFWQHLWQTVLADYVTTSLWLMLGVGFGVLLLGVPTAWLSSHYIFPGSRWLSWALMLPLAFPAYIIAYVYTGLLDAAGPAQAWLQNQIPGWSISIPIRSLAGAIVMMSLVLYPYVYLLSRTAFLEQSISLVDAGRSLGCSKRSLFFRIVLPLVRPAMVAGLMLALMETLADFGTVQYFGVSAFTTGIFRTFYGYGEIAAAAQLSAILLLFVVVLISLERYSRRKIIYQQVKGKPLKKRRLEKRQAWLATSICFLPFLLGFLVPSLALLYWALFEAVIDEGFVELIWNSCYLAIMAAVIALFCSLLLAYAKRYDKSVLTQKAVAFSSMGYALPGTIAAIGVMIPFAWLDHQLIDAFDRWFNIDIGLLLSGTLFALLFVYTVRFLAVSLGPIDSGLQAIKPNLDQAATLLGRKPFVLLREIHVPLLRRSVLTALLIVFVDVLKELPATLMLRPFDFNTLAVRAYELASDERLIDAAPASLLIVGVGLLPVILLNRSIVSEK